jgi:uncharacterized repeat protein (TIGR03803 family)
MRFPRLPVAFLIVIATLGASALVGVRIAAQTAPVAKPANRLCVLCDLGTSAEAPSMPQQLGLMVDGGDGYIYGTSSSGGQSTLTGNQGTIFRFSTRTGALKTLYSFDNVDHGANPMSGLMRASDGVFYGTTYQGGRFHFIANMTDVANYGVGALFRYKAGASEPEVLHTFRNGSLAGLPVRCKDKPQFHCYNTPQQRLNAAAGYPMSVPVEASDGNFYGVASKGGNYNTGILYRFKPPAASQKVVGNAIAYGNVEGLITAVCIDGPIFGDDDEPSDADLINRCMFHGALGVNPSSLTVSSTYPGKLFGTTVGKTPEAPNGTVFQVNLGAAALGGLVTTLKNFTDPTDGSQPNSVTVGSNGYLYGTTRFGGYVGMGNPAAGGGVVFRIIPGVSGVFAAAAGSSFQVIHKLNAREDGSGPVSQPLEVKVATLDPATGIPGPERTYIYGNASGAGEGRGVIFRVDETAVAESYDVVYTFPSVWQASGSFPLSSMIASTDPTTNRLVLYGTTQRGGARDFGVIFRLGGLDLPRVGQSQYPILFSATPTSMRTGPLTFPAPRQPLAVSVSVQTHVNATQTGAAGTSQTIADGLRIDAVNCLNPHIVQFISRSKKNMVTGQYVVGTYTLPSGSQYPFSDPDQGQTFWHVDAAQGPPNPYFEENFGSVHLVTANSITTFDAPSFSVLEVRPNTNLWNYHDGDPELWRAVLKDYVICSCQVVAVVKWAREASAYLDPDPKKVRHSAPYYPAADLSITAATADDLTWVNDHLKSPVQSDGAFESIP